MKNRLSFVALLVICAACGCPPDVQIGSVMLQSRTFWPYTGNETLVFENSIGDTVALVTQLFSTQGTQLRQERLCQKALVGQQWTYYQSVIGYTQVFKPLNTDHFLELRFNLDVDQVPSDTTVRDTVFFEAFTINASVRNPLQGGGYFYFPTSTRGNDPTRIRNYARFVPRIIPDTILGTRRFKNVYTQPDVRSLFFTKELGLVAVRTSERTWTLKRHIRR